ncbi:MAG: 8-oxo-dGTP diphosphatase, partial [bacterium]|nr:8-oxo-dGTP diphosphatase [bacterium]
MKTGTLCLVMDGEKILLGMKKEGFGAGRWNGFGGKVKDGETLESTALRELDEEAGIQSDSSHLDKVAVLTFHFAGNPEWQVHVFRVASWSGEPHETKEMRPEWHRINTIPYGEMWEADRHWLPLVLSGKRIEADVFYKDLSNDVFENFKW